jgi:streptogramin lyase
MKALATGPGGTFLFGAWTSGRWSGLTVVRPNGRVDRFSRLEREGWVHLWSEGAGLHREALSGTRPSSDEIRAISVDAQGEVWCATPQGLNRFDGQKWQIFMAPGGLAENDLTSVAVAPDGAVWCGTRERGLRCYRAGRWQTFTPSEGLADLRVQVLAAAPSGRIYAGTARGLSLYEPTRAAWQTVTDPAGPGEASITSLALDGETLWVGTPEGLWCFQGVIHALRRTTKPEHVGQSVRLPSPAEQTNSLRYMDRGGAWLHYSLLDGLPTNHVASLAVPRPGELYLWTKAGGLLRHVRETVPPQVWFPPKTPKVVRTSQALTFPVHGADLGCAPEELQYSWRLVPGEEAWSPFQARSVLDVGSRPNGSYRLEVRARDRDGNVSHSAVHRFTVDADPVKIVSLYLGDAPHINALFPALHTRYAQLGGVHLVLRNQRPTAVEATCTVQLEGWMDRPLSETHVLEAEETQVLPLPLPLSAAVLKLSEERTVTAEVTVQVPSQDSAPPPLVRQHVPVRIYHPKRIYWGWPEMAAAFITPEDPRIQDALRSKWRIDPQAPRIRRVEARYETVQRWGVSYACDPNNPFSVVHSRKQLDSLQFPRQLLTRRAGDCDDLAVFFATLLEASGIPTALVHTDEHVLVAFQDDNGPLSRQFARYRLPGTPWIPVETTLLDAQGKDQTSFLSALLQAQAICQQSVRKPALYETARAWEEYPAATWPAEESGGR